VGEATVVEIDLTTKVPLAEAATRLGMNRERIIRRIQDGEIEGGQVAGRWFVERSALPRARSGASEARASKGQNVGSPRVSTK
jgi:hypothetical protein